MKKIINMLLIAVVCYSTTFAQKITNDKVPATVNKAFTAKFPAAQNVTWEMEKSKYEASFTNNGEKQSAVFNSKGNWFETEVEIKNSALPQPVSQSLAKQYPGFAVKEAAQLDTPDKGKIYEVVISKGSERYEIKFSPSGEVLKKETETERK